MRLVHPDREWKVTEKPLRTQRNEHLDRLARRQELGKYEQDGLMVWLEASEEGDVMKLQRTVGTQEFQKRRQDRTLVRRITQPGKSC